MKKRDIREGKGDEGRWGMRKRGSGEAGDEGREKNEHGDTIIFVVIFTLAIVIMATNIDINCL